MERLSVVILERIEPGEPKPDYCIHGRATCIADCGEWVWLGHATHELVTSGKAAPLCTECAARLVPPGTQPTGHVRDHRRADGPHT